MRCGWRRGEHKVRRNDREFAHRYGRDLGGLFVTGFGMGRQAHATEIRNDDSVVFDQYFGEGYPHISRVAEPMQQEHRRALTADPNILGASAYRHLPGAKGVRPDADRCVGCRRPGCKRRCEGRQRCGEQWMQRDK